jgi:cold shock CspA family protein
LQECSYNEDAVANILSFHDVQKNYRITYDNESRDVFTVHLSSAQQLEFRPLKNGLYVWKPKKNTTEMSFVTTVEENKSFYTNREIERAKAAREYFHAMGTPSVPDLLAMIRMNLVKDCPITTEDV